MNYEERIIDTILNTIKDNQEYLTKPENLPQLAKLGYMYNSLWYGGRHASYKGVITKAKLVEEDGSVYEYDQCDDNPKYKIEMCDPMSEEIEDYIYDAWSMHVSNNFGPSWDEFRQIVVDGKPLTDLEKKLLKPNKTFDEWVEALTDPTYRYSSLYPDRRSVADHLLCVIGNGYGYKNGFVISEAGGADQDDTDYGDWMNVKFAPHIQEIVDKIMSDPEVEVVLRFIGKEKEEYRIKEEKKEIASFGMPYKDFVKSDEYKKLFGTGRKGKKEYKPYYPICDYSIITMFDEKTDPSYIKAGIEICEEILAHEELESKRPENVKFAKKFLKQFKK
jgi:hypothetical protein